MFHALTDCSELPGRLREICEGRSGLPRATENAYRTRWGLPPLPEAGVEWTLPAGQLVCGVTTAPRPENTSYLGRCVESLVRAGATDVRIFAEPESYLGDVINKTHVTVVQRPYRFGAWYNWLAMANQLLDESSAPMIMTVQDDTVFATDALRYAADHWCELLDVGFLSLYTPKHYQVKWLVKRGDRALRHAATEEEAARFAAKLPGGYHEKYTWPEGINRIRTRALWGTCAVIFPREVLRQAINTRIAARWKGVASKRKREREPWEIANVDTAIGRMMNQLRRSMYFVNPAMAQHIADVSAIGHGGRGGRREAMRVVKELEGV